MAQIATQQLALRIGNRKTVLLVNSLAVAQRTVNELRDKLELAGKGGASRFPTVRILDLNAGGAVIGHVSYNGRMWEGEAGTWTTATREMKANA